MPSPGSTTRTSTRCSPTTSATTGTTGRSTAPGRPPWTDNFAKNFPQLRGLNFGFTTTVAANPTGAGKKTGLAPQDVAGWNYGQIAQNLDKQNARLGARHLGPQTRADPGRLR